MPLRARPLFALAAALLSAAALAQPQTVCTVTINSPDERDAMQRLLPADRFHFVELVQPGRSDWFADACKAQVQCDVLVVSGHFAGTEFYSSRPTANQTLKVADMRGALCSDSCPGVFQHLKEVYLFGCDTLKAEPTRSATPEVVRTLLAEGRSPTEAAAIARALSVRHAESSRDTVRRLFPEVPVIYGFASLAPLGRHAGPMLAQYLASGGSEEVGTGRPSARLLSLFGASSMVATQGVMPDEPAAREAAAACRAYDARLDEDARVDAMHALLSGPATEVRMGFDRIEAFFGTAPATTPAFKRVTGDRGAAGRFIALARKTHDPALRLRMIGLARTVGWLDAAGERQERVALVGDVIRDVSMDYGEVDLVCGLNADGTLVEPAALDMGLPAMTVPQAAGLACLGDVAARRRTLAAVASLQERDVRAAQAYLRHHPIDDAGQLRDLVVAVTAMDHETAQVRALETLARQHLDDHASLGVLEALYARTRSPAVQHAVAEIFLRAGPAAFDADQVRTAFRAHRLRAGGDDLIDQLVRGPAS